MHNFRLKNLENPTLVEASDLAEVRNTIILSRKQIMLAYIGIV